MPHILGEDRFSHSSSLGGRSCLLNNSREKSSWKFQKTFSDCFGFLLNCCFQGVSCSLMEMAQLYSVHLPSVAVIMRGST